MPFLDRGERTAGVSATRRSPGNVSVGTPTIIGDASPFV
jgi:hypothetical protein